MKTKPTPSSRSTVPQPTAEEPNEGSDAESSSSPASPPIVSDIADYNLAQDKIIYVWYVQIRGRAIKAEKERKKLQAIEAALTSHASSILKIC